MMMQWFINECHEAFERVDQKIEGWARSQVEAAERIKKLEGELRAMKARAGKQQKQTDQGIDER
jgi:hypothetical protein